MRAALVIVALAACGSGYPPPAIVTKADVDSVRGFWCTTDGLCVVERDRCEQRSQCSWQTDAYCSRSADGSVCAASENECDEIAIRAGFHERCLLAPKSGRL